MIVFARTSDADVLADGLEVSHDPRRGTEVIHAQRPRLRTKRQTHLETRTAGDAALRLTTRVVPDPECRVSTHQGLDELAEVVSVVELDGDLVPGLLHHVITCVPALCYVDIAVAVPSGAS